MDEPSIRQSLRGHQEAIGEVSAEDQRRAIPTAKKTQNQLNSYQKLIVTNKGENSAGVIVYSLVSVPALRDEEDGRVGACTKAEPKNLKVAKKMEK